jgi:threonine/homoserine/homoserine lactone efflux protein
LEFAFLKGLGLGLWLSISVGPIIFTILKLSIKCGHRAGYAFIVGVAASDLLLVILGNFAAQLVRDALKYEAYIAVGGAFLLLGMGLFSFFFGKDPKMDNSDLPPEYSRSDMAKFSLQGFLMNILNPGPIFFWLTTCTTIAAELPLSEKLTLFGTCLGFVFLTDFFKVKLAGRIRGWLTPSTLHKIHQISALALIVFGLVIGIGVIYTKLYK